MKVFNLFIYYQIIMTYICALCKLQPLSHSLTKVSEKEDIIYYYTCPAQALLYYDVEGIINHYDGVLQKMGLDI